MQVFCQPHTRLLPAMAAAIPPPGEVGGDAELLIGPPLAPAAPALFSLDWEPRRAGPWWISLGVVPMKRRSPSHEGRILPIMVGASVSAGVGGGAVVVGVVMVLGEVARLAGSADSLLPL